MPRSCGFYGIGNLVWLNERETSTTCERRLIRYERMVESGVVGAFHPDDMAEDILNGFYDEGTEFIRVLTMKDTPRPSMEDVFPSVEICFTLKRRASSPGAYLDKRETPTW